MIPKQQRAMALWLYQRISAPLVAVLLWLHFHVVINRFAASGGITYQELKGILSQPLYKILEIAFFFFALSHGLNGMRMIIDHYIHNHVLKLICIIGGWCPMGIAFLYVTYLLIRI